MPQTQIQQELLEQLTLVAEEVEVLLLELAELAVQE